MLSALSTSAIALFLAGGAGTAFAASPSALARAHIRDVAKGKVAALVAQYGPEPVLEWVGGPLNGRYLGTDAIRGVWGKFAKANGLLKAEVTHVQAAANPAGATVTADVRFTGKATIPVRYVLTYRSGKLVDEIWQIDPHLAKSAGY
ncbi:MAG: nuclear transport factor 2 family protein [Betaproteobacteria bacterium]|nr:nuclear transport factor 2 family protein [Betaproteobacteria bacterium]